MWLADQQFVLPINWTGVPNKMAGECIYTYMHLLYVCVCVLKIYNKI